MTIYKWEGTILREDGKIAISEACCCEEGVAELWLYCTSGSATAPAYQQPDVSAIYLPTSATNLDYGWICANFPWDSDGGTFWASCYLSGVVSGITPNNYNYFLPDRDWETDG